MLLSSLLWVSHLLPALVSRDLLRLLADRADIGTSPYSPLMYLDPPALRAGAYSSSSKKKISNATVVNSRWSDFSHQVEFVSSLPKTITGKINRAKLRTEEWKTSRQGQAQWDSQDPHCGSVFPIPSWDFSVFLRRHKSTHTEACMWFLSLFSY